MSGPREIGRIALASLPPGHMARLERPPFHVLVVNVDGTVHAIEDACPHSGWSLCEGRLAGPEVTCPGHGWVIDVRDGAVRTEAGLGERNPVFPVRIESDWAVVYDASPERV